MQKNQHLIYHNQTKLQHPLLNKLNKPNFFLQHLHTARH